MLNKFEYGRVLGRNPNKNLVFSLTGVNQKFESIISASYIFPSYIDSNELGEKRRPKLSNFIHALYRCFSRWLFYLNLSILLFGTFM